MNDIYLTAEEQEEFDREEEELERFFYPEPRDIPSEYIKPAETERFMRHDYDGIDGTHGSWTKENGDLISDSDPFDEDATDY